MKKIKLTVELKYDDKLWHGGDKDVVAKAWFMNELLGNDVTLSIEGDVGDVVGKIKVLKISNK